MLIGYARVSTADQNLDLQTDALTKAACEKIYHDKISGAKAERPGLAKVLEISRSGDTLVIWRLDRLGRSLKDLIQIAETLKERSIGLKSLEEGIDTTTSTGQLMFHLFGALAEFEKNLINERSKAGLNAARARGKLGGRPKALDRNQQQLAIKLYNERQHSIAEICQMMKISKPTLYSYVSSSAQNTPCSSSILDSSSM
jgi:DNA invertase Pin-like site-specific DNA recombinase